MIQVIGEILPYAVGAAIGASPIVVAVLLLFGARARVNAPSFLAGWAVGLAVAVLVVTLVASFVGAHSGDPSTVAAWIKVAIGVLFLVLAFGQWRSRPKDDGAKEDPGWMRMFEDVNAIGAFVIGFTMTTVANPKNLALAGATGLAIAQAGLGRGEAIVALVVFAGIGSVSIAVPVAYGLLGGEPAHRALTTWRAGLTEHNAAVMLALFLVLGAVSLGRGLEALAG